MAKKTVILIANEGRRVSATIYGDDHYGKGGYKVKFRRNPEAALVRSSRNTIIYPPSARRGGSRG